MKSFIINSTPPSFSLGTGVDCSDYGFRCAVGGHCVAEVGVCNGAVDCPDGSDEADRVCRPTTPTRGPIIGDGKLTNLM